jgi:hypothetical protein
VNHEGHLDCLGRGDCSWANPIFGIARTGPDPDDRCVANGVVRIARACEIKAIVIVAVRIADGGAYRRMWG